MARGIERTGSKSKRPARRHHDWREHLFAHAPAAPTGWEPGGGWEMECEKVFLVLPYEATAHSDKFSQTTGSNIRQWFANITVAQVPCTKVTVCWFSADRLTSG